ncbi:hypothetical protein MtrunA17_Chr1g0198611 [Medicago truncatula]|uniref:Uncharacterized protein n=1 Tax=Medicago truncatula TaxID=3880 RepID=A0A396JV36_MEDTR|nr:hypothetical protein MtrunA17_Chr1g0198611 [Medicago truncatula]
MPLMHKGKHIGNTRRNMGNILRWSLNIACRNEIQLANILTRHLKKARVYELKELI